MKTIEIHQVRALQALAILSTLERAGRDVLIERTPEGVRVECASADGQGYSCNGVSVTDALGQLTGALALDLELDLEGEDLEELSKDEMPFTLEPPLEFCTRFVVVDDDAAKFMTAFEGLRAVGGAE